MEAGSLCLTKKVCTKSGRPLCNKDQHPAGTVYLLETRPFRNGNGCIFDSLDKSPRLHLPDLLPLGEVSVEDCQRAGSGRAYLSCMGPFHTVLDTLVEISVLLPLSSWILSTNHIPWCYPMLSSSPPLKRFTSTGVSEQATRLITAGWNEGANTAYQSAGPDGSAGGQDGSGSLFSICDRLHQLLVSVPLH